MEETAEERRARRNEESRKWRAEHKEEIREYNKAYRERHKEGGEERFQQYIKQRRDERREYQRQWERENRERTRERRNEQARERRRANPEKYLAQGRDYRERHREELNARARAYRENNPERVKESLRRHRHQSREWHRQEYRKLKREVIQAYGGKCACCGESHEAFLTIDHYYNNGNEHRHKGGRFSGVHIYRFLKKEGFPKDGYQLLCANCNFAKQHDPEGHRAAHPNAINIEYHGEKQTLRKQDS